MARAPKIRSEDLQTKNRTEEFENRIKPSFRLEERRIQLSIVKARVRMIRKYQACHNQAKSWR